MQSKVSPFAQEPSEQSLEKLQHSNSADTLDLLQEDHEDLSDREFEELLMNRRQRAITQKENTQRLVRSVTQQSSSMRKWMVNHGKSSLLDFTDHHLYKLRQCFKSLCEEREESIGAGDLEDPLIGLGIAESSEEIKDMIRLVDKDGSGKIEFDEFLDIIKSTEGGDKSIKMYNFFKDIAAGNLKGSDNLPFSLLVCKMRREKLFDAITATEGHKKQKGEKLLKAVDKMLTKQKKVKPDTSSLDSF